MNPETSPRQRGRPTTDQAGDLQTRLLDAAETLFAEQGFAATPVRAVAEAAGVNPAMVHYYFGTKRRMLGAVLDRVLEPLARAMGGLRDAPATSLDDIVDLFAPALMAHPALPRLVVREVLLSGGELRETFLRDYAPRLGGALKPLLRREQDAGRLDATLDPGLMTLMVMSLIMFPLVAKDLAEPVLGVRYDADGLDRLQRHIRHALRQGLQA